MAHISMRKYATLRGCSAMAVSLAVKDGRLIRSVKRDEAGKPIGIDPDIADIEWTRNTDHSKIPLSMPQKKSPPAEPAAVDFEPFIAKQPSPPANNGTPKDWQANRAQPHGGRLNTGGPEKAAPEAGTDAANFAAARAKREAYQAEIARLDFEERQGTLVDAEKVRSEAFKTARRVRDGLLNIPDRVSAELAGLTDPFLIHQRLTEEVRQVLGELSQLAEPEETMVANG